MFPRRLRRLLLIVIAALIALWLLWQPLPPSEVTRSATYYLNIQPVIATLPENSQTDPAFAQKHYYEARGWMQKDTPYHYVLAAEGFVKALSFDHTYVAAVAGYLDSMSHLHRLKLITEERFAQVNQLAKQAHHLYPQSPLIMRSMALIRLLKREWHPAETLLQEVLQKLPGDAETETLTGYRWYLQKKYSEAETILLRITEESKRSENPGLFSIYLLAETYGASRKESERGRMYQWLYTLNPIHPFLLAHLAKKAYAQADIQKQQLGDLWVQTLAALGAYLPVDLHFFAYSHMITRSVIPKTEKKYRALLFFLAHYYASIRNDPQWRVILEGIPETLTSEELTRVHRLVFSDIKRLRTVAETFYAMPDNVQVGVDLFLLCLRINPNQPEIYQKLGDYYSFIQTPEAQGKALAFYEQALRYDRGLKEIVFKVFHKAMTFYDHRTAARVLHNYETFLKEQSPKPAVDYRLWLSYGELYQALKDPIKALQYYRKARGIVPHDVRVLKRMSKVAEEADAVTDAIVLLKQAQKFAPNDPEISSRIYVLFAKEGRKLSSIRMALEYLALHPEDGWGHLTIGKVYALLNDQAKAIESLQKGLEKLPQDQEGWELLAKIYRQAGESAKALEAYQKMSEARTIPEGYAQAAQYALQLGQKETALRYFLKAVKINFRYPGATIQIARLFRNLNYPNEAITYYQRAITLEPHEILYQIELGDYLVESEYYEVAEAYFTKLHEQYPKNVIAMIYVARMNRLLTRYSKAREFSDMALRLDPKSPDANKELGLAYYNLEEKAVAKKYLSSYLELYPTAPDGEEIRKLVP